MTLSSNAVSDDNVAKITKFSFQYWSVPVYHILEKIIVYILGLRCLVRHNPTRLDRFGGLEEQFYSKW